MVSIDTKYVDVPMGSGIIVMSHTTEVKRKESRTEIQTYLDRLHYALSNGYAKINFQNVRRVELVDSLIGGGDCIFVMSFHYSERDFKESDFPYKKV